MSAVDDSEVNNEGFRVVTLTRVLDVRGTD